MGKRYLSLPIVDFDANVVVIVYIAFLLSFNIVKVLLKYLSSIRLVYFM